MIAWTSLPLALCLVEPSSLRPQADERPVLSGPTLTLDTADGRFKIHYTMEGRDAVVLPDTVAWAEAGATRMVDVFSGEDGWPTPVSDEGVGGDDRLDIYLRILPEGSRGFAYAEVTPSGKVSGYIEVTPAAAELGEVPFQSVVGHEVFHILELAVGRSFVASWIAEASAAYAQYLLFTGEDRFLQLAREALWQIRLGGSARELDNLDGTYEYAGLVWVKYLIDRGGGNRKLLLRLWQAMAERRNWVQGHNQLLPSIGVASLDDAAAEHAVWNWFACGNDDGLHYDPTTNWCSLPLVAKAETAARPPSEGTSAPIAFRGSGYLEVARDCASADLSLRLRPTGKMRFQLIAETAGAASPVTGVVVEGGAEGTLELAGWNRGERAVVVATSLSLPPATFRWSTQVSGAYEPGTLPAPSGLSITSPAVALAEGAEAQLQVSALYGTCEDGRDVTAAVTWVSTDEKVVVARAGKLAAVGGGTAQVYAQAGAVTSNRIEVTVTAAPDEGGCSTGGTRGAWLLALVALLWLRRERRIRTP